jgi:hypothetical protein
MKNQIFSALNTAFPFILAVLLPLAGLALAGVSFSREEPEQGMQLVGATLLGASVWALVLTQM